MANRTPEEIIQSMVDYVTAYNSSKAKNIDTRQGTVFKDVVIDSPSQEISSTYTDITYAGKMASLNYATELSTEDLNALGDNIKLPRKTATQSVGFCDFITSATSSNPPIANIPIPAGTIVKVPATATDSEIQFQTTVSNTIFIANLVNYQFTDTDGKIRYKITIPIIAVTPGSDGNVSSFTITDLTSSISGILKTRNTDPTTGGTDLESNESYGTRIQEKQAGNNVGTVSGLKSLLLQDSRVINVAVVLPKDPEMLRDQFGGSVDMYVLGQDFQQTQDLISFTSGTTGSTITLSKVPAISLTSVSGTVGGTGYSFDLLNQVSVLKDITILKDTVNETSKVQFLTSVVPDPGTLVTVNLTYDKLIPDLQNIVDADSNHIVASDILVRRSYEVTVDIEMTVSLFSGFIPNDVATAINTKLVNTIDAYNLNDNLNTSDIISIADSTNGVNSINLISPTTTVVSGKTGYIRVGVTTIHIGNDTFTF